MFARVRPWAIAALASATLSAGALAAPVYVDVRVAPPPPRGEATPVVRPGYLWVPGYWDWSGHHHVWVNGTWVRARPGYYYANPAWVHDGDRWRLRRGGWNRGDRDHDGVPNRYDRHPDNPYRP